jgi:hypothetical protein
MRVAPAMFVAFAAAFVAECDSAESITKLGCQP